MERTTALLVSYCPLFDYKTLDYQPGQAKQPTDEVLKQIGDAIAETEGTADACLWMLSDKLLGRERTPFPILVMENGDKIVEHLTWWTETDPSKWFTLYIADNFDDAGRAHDHYGVVLMPNLKLTVKRWQTAYLMANEECPLNFDYQIFFRPLSFGSGDSTNYTKLKDRLPAAGAVMEFGIIDVEHVNKENVARSDFEGVHKFSFKRGANEEISKFLSGESGFFSTLTGPVVPAWYKGDV